jgi:hypothetical protein
VNKWFLGSEDQMEIPADSVQLGNKIIAQFERKKKRASNKLIKKLGGIERVRELQNPEPAPPGTIPSVELIPGSRFQREVMKLADSDPEIERLIADLQLASVMIKTTREQFIPPADKGNAK